MVEEYEEAISSGIWVSKDCFVFVSQRGSLSYLVGDKILKLGNAGPKQHILGYDGKKNRLYLTDKSLSIYAHRLMLSVLDYQVCILRGDPESATNLLHEIPESYHGKLAKFLE